MKDIQQLIKKNSQEGRYEDIFPKTFIDAVEDRESGNNLTEILSGFNMYFLSYNGSREQTRLQVPMSIRKTGLWITYVLYDKTVITEWYAGEAIDDNSWKNLSNWRVGTNMLVGDISISSDGYWVVNGVVTTTKAQGEQGITPMLRVGSNNHLQVSYTNGSSWVDVSTNPVYTQFRINNNKLEQSVDLGQTWTVVSDYIASWFRFTGTTGSSQADNVGKIQISRDNGVTWADLSGEFTNSLHIKGYVATVGVLPSSAVQGDIYGVGPTYDPSDTAQTNPIYQLYVKDSTGWVNNGKFTSIAAGVVQTTGTSTTEVMSQDAVSKEFASVRSELSGTPVYNSTLTFIGEVNKTLYNIVNEGFFTISLSSDTGINIDLYYRKTDGNLSLLKNISDYKNKLIYIPSDFQGNLLFHNNDNSTVTVTVVLRKSGQINRIENLENDIEIDKIDTFGEKLYSNNLTFSSGVANRNIEGAVSPNLICYLKIQSTYQLDISVNIQTTLGYQEIMYINESGIYRMTIPNESINNILILTSTSIETINATVDVIKDGISNKLDYVDSIITDIDGSYISYTKLTYTGIQNKRISLFEKNSIYEISIHPKSILVEDPLSIMYLSTDSTYKEIMSINDSDNYSFRFPDDASNNSILLFHAKNTNISVSVSIKKNTYKSLLHYVRRQQISNSDLFDIKNRLYNIENLPNYNNIVIVSASGTIGTDCDYNDIKSALDYAADGSKSNRYLIFVKNGDYDISNMTDAYLGLRNYVDIIGESITNVRVINRRSAYDILACCFDTHKYAISGGIEDAMLANMTLISYNCKSPFHSDYGGKDIKYGGVVTLKNIRLVNENDNTSVSYRDGIACGIISGRKIKCINCFGNVYIWIHNWENNDHYKEGAVVELTNCNVLNIGCKDLGSMANDRLIIDGCTANLVFVGNMNNAVSNSRCSWSLDFKGNNNIGYVLPEPNQNWYSQFPFCVNGIHRSAINTNNIRINKGDLVSMSYINSGVVESSNDAIHELGVVPYNGNYLYGISLDDIEPGSEGIIQYSGVIKQSTSLSLQLGNYVKAFENSFILSTKSEADGIVVAIDGIGTWIKLFNRI